MNTISVAIRLTIGVILLSLVSSAEIRVIDDDQQSTAYRAAAVQHAALGVVTDPSSAIRLNIAAYDHYAQKASNASSDIIVFNEGGLGMFLANDRNQARLFCEKFPVSGEEGIIPCDNSNYSNRYQISSLSCLAKKYSFYLVADLCDIIECDPTTDPLCPSDNAYQYNAQIVFGPKGEYITKYHKTHLFGESNLFDAAKPEPVTFIANINGNFIKFGLFICFDIEFPHPSLDLINNGIKHFTYSSHWFDLSPAETAVSVQQSFSRKYGINLIAANTADPEGSGSGIYSKGEVLAFAFNPYAPLSSPDNQVIIADLPIDIDREIKKNKPIIASVPLSKNQVQSIDNKLFDNNSAPPEVYRSCWLSYPFIGPRGNCSLIDMSSISTSSIVSLSSSHNGLQCSASFSLTPSGSASNTFFALFSYRGTMIFPYTPDPLSLEVCSLLNCVYNHSITTGDIICSFDYQSNVHFQNYQIEADGFGKTTELFPLLSIDKGGLVSPQLSLFNEKIDNNGIRSATLKTKGEVDEQILFASVYGVVPKDSN